MGNKLKCFVDNCKSQVLAKGFCNKHYIRNKKYGSPYVYNTCELPIKYKIERHIERVTESGCWIWKGDSVNGYGRMHLKGKNFLVHRLSYEEFVGEIPDGLHVLHRCDVPACVNPSHLFTGTHQDNMDDKMRKGRWKSGGNKKLNKSQVEAIRMRLNKGERHIDIAKDYPIPASTVTKISSGEV